MTDSAFLPTPEAFDILDRLDLRRSVSERDGYGPMDVVRAFLAANALDPTPDHYRLAYDALVLGKASLARGIMAALEEEGRLSADAASRLIMAEKNDLPTALIEELIDTSQANLERLAVILGRSRDDARAYGNDLQSGATAMSQSGLPQKLLANFMELTQSLIGRTRDAEDRMHELDDQIKDLKTSLDDATHAADSDQLTGLSNRRALERRLSLAVAQAQIDGSPLTLAYCDIDHFKLINDTHGHEVGDRILKFVGQLLMREADPETLVARYGGEEFVMLFEHVPFERVIEIVNELRLELGARRLVLRDSGEAIGNITFSAGVAHLEAGQDGDQLLRNADRALYRAKELGRDRIVSAHDIRLMPPRRSLGG